MKEKRAQSYSNTIMENLHINSSKWIFFRKYFIRFVNYYVISVCFTS